MHGLSHRGASMLELLAVVAILGVMASIAFPNVNSMNGQMKAAQDSRAIVYTLGELRGEAIRLKTRVNVQFDTHKMTWDIDGDGTTDGTLDLDDNSTWAGGTPATIAFDGLGLASSIVGTRTITVVNRSSNLSFTVNANGHVELL